MYELFIRIRIPVGSDVYSAESTLIHEREIELIKSRPES